MSEDCTIYKWSLCDERGTLAAIHATTRTALDYLAWFRECSQLDAWIALEGKSETPEEGKFIAAWVEIIREVKRTEAQERANQTTDIVQ